LDQELIITRFNDQSKINNFVSFQQQITGSFHHTISKLSTRLSAM